MKNLIKFLVVCTILFTLSVYMTSCSQYTCPTYSKNTLKKVDNVRNPI